MVPCETSIIGEQEVVIFCDVSYHGNRKALQKNMRFYCPISKIRLMEHDHTKRGYSCRVSYLRVLCSRSFKVIKSMVFL